MSKRRLHNRQYIAQAFATYRNLAVPAAASDIQVRETRQAFFAGACFYHEFCMEKLSEGEEVTATDLRMMESFTLEVEAFGKEVDRRIFGAETVDA